MSTMESDGIDEVLQGVTQVALTAAARAGEQLARARQQAARHAQERSEQAARYYASRLHAEREAAHAALAPVHREDWWDAATRRDVTQAYETAAAWRQTDPEAERAHARIVEEARSRFGVELDAEGRSSRGGEVPEGGADAALTLTAEEEARRARSVAIFRDDFGIDQKAAEQLADEQVRNRRAEAAAQSAQSERADAAALMVRADALDRVAETAGTPDRQGDGADRLRADVELAWDSAERRAALAASLDQVENRTAVDARLTADIAQARPAGASIHAKPGRAVRAQSTSLRPGAVRAAQRSEHSR